MTASPTPHLLDADEPLPNGAPRAVCYTCFRPAAVCYCDHAPRVDNRTHVTIVQHPREQFHPLGTARIVARCLNNVELMVAHAGWARAGARELFPEGAALLYPGPGARELASIPAHERPRALVALDGTWHHARTLYRDHPVLHQLPLVSFVPSAPTEYRVRREPKEEYVSTVEAVAIALELLEPELGARELLAPFRRMIDLHIEATQRSERKPRHRHPRSVHDRTVPRALGEEFHRVVLVYGEGNPVGRTGRTGQLAPLVSWSAKRLSENAVFSELVRPDPPVSEWHCQLLGLAQGDFERACSLSELRTRWKAFLKPDDLILAWNKSSFDLMRELDVTRGHLTLKAAYRGYHEARARKGDLEAVVQAERLVWARAAVLGRAAERLGRAEAVARHLHACGV